VAKAITTNIHVNRMAKMTGWEYRDLHTMEGEALHLKKEMSIASVSWTFFCSHSYLDKSLTLT